MLAEQLFQRACARRGEHLCVALIAFDRQRSHFHRGKVDRQTGRPVSPGVICGDKNVIAPRGQFTEGQREVRQLFRLAVRKMRVCLDIRFQCFGRRARVESRTAACKLRRDARDVDRLYGDPIGSGAIIHRIVGRKRIFIRFPAHGHAHVVGVLPSPFAGRVACYFQFGERIAGIDDFLDFRRNGRLRALAHEIGVIAHVAVVHAHDLAVLAVVRQDGTGGIRMHAFAGKIHNRYGCSVLGNAVPRTHLKRAGELVGYRNHGFAEIDAPDLRVAGQFQRAAVPDIIEIIAVRVDDFSARNHGRARILVHARALHYVVAKVLARVAVIDDFAARHGEIPALHEQARALPGPISLIRFGSAILGDDAAVHFHRAVFQIHAAAALGLVAHDGAVAR